jgi:hypothetical protein
VDVPVGGTPPPGAPDLEASTLNGLEADVAAAFDYQPGEIVVVSKNSSGNWPTSFTADRTAVYGAGAAPDASARPTNRQDVRVIFQGPDPSPAPATTQGVITDGMYDHDLRFVEPTP